ncbi:MAG: hypothetical protein JNG84_00160 [Archangium sp.]|nr:hypothetical protein [Archangium sp.]
MAGVSAELPGFDAIPRAKALAVLLWQASVVHTADHLTYFDAAMRHGFMRVPRTLRRTFTARHVSAWDRWKTRNFLKTFVTFNAHPGLDQRLLNVDAYAFEPGSAPHAAAQTLKRELLELDARLTSERRALVPAEQMIQSVCL